MKGKKLLTVLLYGIVAWGIAFCGAGCIVTAFSFEGGLVISSVTSSVTASVSGTSKMVDMQAVALWSAAISLLSVFVFSKKQGWAALPVMAALVLGVLFVTGRLEELYALAYRISVFYDKAYHWGRLPMAAEIGKSALTGGLVTVCALVVLLVSWVLCSRKPAAVAVAAGALPLALCCVVTDTVPDEKYLFPLLAGLSLVVLTNAVRRDEEKTGARLTAMVMVPVLLFSTVLSNALPREAYERQSETVLQTLLNWVQELPFVVQMPDGSLEISVAGTAPGSIDLAAVGPQAKVSYPVMDVMSTVSQRLYLRGQSFDTYDGKNWSASEHSTGYDSGWPTDTGTIGQVTISTRSRLSYRFVPYYTDATEIKNMVLGKVEDPVARREYTYTLKKYVPFQILFPNNMSAVCVNLPEKTEAKAVELWNQIWWDNAPTTVPINRKKEAKANVILEYVKNSAKYSRNTPQMPADAEDFALWFLENSETGYCVHFATAAAVLLRAAGVPARYVTGYTVDAVEGQRVTVTADQSHAWVEYLNDDNVWVVLDPTPEEESEDPPVTEPGPTEPEPTDPDPTDPDPTQGQTSTNPVIPTLPPQTDPAPTGGVGGQEGDRTALWTALKWLAGILSTAAVLALQYILRRQLRQKKRQQGHPNRQALCRYREAKRMARLVGQKVPEALYSLAEKAKFSQHTLTEEELAQMDAYLAQAQQLLCQKPWPLRFVIRLIWAV